MTPTEITTVPLDLLVRSEDNIRKTGTGIGIAELAESIARDGLLQNLVVVKANGKKTYEVIAGGRRLAALNFLAKQKRIPVNHPVPVRVAGMHQEAGVLSLAENQMREQMHPLDQLRAFKAMVDSEESVTDVASRFGVTEAFVKQRLKLATVAPKILDEYAAGKLTLEHLQAFTISDDHKEQLEVLAELRDENGNDFDAQDIKGCLWKEAVTTDDPRLKYVGLKAYQKAGGAIIKPDLFATDEDEDDELVSDPKLLNDMAMSKLVKAAAKLQKDEGLAWVETKIGNFSLYGDEADYCRVQMTRLNPSAELAKQIEKLEDEVERLVKAEDKARDDDNYDEADRLDAEADVLREQLDAIEQTLKQPHPEEAPHAGAFVVLGYGGKVQIERNLIRKQHRAKDAPKASKAPGSKDSNDEDQPEAFAHSEKLTKRLTAHKTQILRNEIAHDPRGGLEIMVYQLLIEDLRGELSGFVIGPLTMSTRDEHLLDKEADDIDSNPATAKLLKLEVQLLYPIRAELSKVAEDKATALYKYLQGAPEKELMSLLSFYVAMRADIVVGHEKDAGGARSQALVSTYITDNIIEHAWKPTRASYLDHVSKAQVIAAVREARGEEEAAKLAPLKKAAAAEQAEEMLADMGWLPSPLRVEA